MASWKNRSLAAAALVCAFCVPVIAQQGGAQEGNVLERSGKHFKVVFQHGKLKPELAAVLADQAQVSLEAFWPVLNKMLPIKDGPVRRIDLYADEMTYRVAENKSPVKCKREAFVGTGLDAHVLLWPQLTPQILTAIGLPGTTIENLRMVAAEQVVASVTPASDEGDWLRRVVVMGAVEAASNPKGEYGVDVAFDTRRTWVPPRLEVNSMATLDSLLQIDMACIDRDGWNTRVDYCTVVADYLSHTSSGWAKKLLGKQRELKGRVQAYDRRKQAVESVIGADWKKNEERFLKACKAMKPLWGQRVPECVLSSPRFLLAGTKRDSALLSAVEPPPPGDYVISARCQFGAGDESQGMRIEFGWDDSSLVAAMFHPRSASISLWEQSTGKWKDLVEQRVKLPQDEPFDVKVEVTAKMVRIFVGEQQVGEWAPGGRELHRLWGIGVNERVVWVEGPRIAPLVPQKPK
jgi:hypothetical protein